MVDAVSDLLEKMKRGEQTGVMFISSSATGDDLTGVYGEFADRLQYAVYAATKGLNSLVTLVAESQGVGHTTVDSISGKQAADPSQERPPRLKRKA